MKTTEELLKELETLKPIDYENDPVFTADYAKGIVVERFLNIMEEENITQSELASRLGKSRQYVSKILNEKGNFTIDSLAAISAALDHKLTIEIEALTGEYMVEDSTPSNVVEISQFRIYSNDFYKDTDYTPEAPTALKEGFSDEKSYSVG